MKWLLGLIALALFGGGGGWWWWSSSKGGGAVATAFSDDGLFRVKKGDLPITLTENGTLVAKESQKIVPLFRGHGKITFIVEEGKVVQEGDELCKFDTTELQQQIDQVQLDIAKGEADLATSRTEEEIQEKQNKQDVKKAQIALEKSEKDQEKYEKADVRQERRKNEIAIKEATTAAEKASKKFADSKQLYAKNPDFISKSELDQDEQDAERTQVALERAKADSDIFEEYTLPMTTRDKQVAVEDAELGLDTASKRAESTLRQKQVSVEQNDKRLKKMQDQLKERQEELSKMVLKAPCPGIVIYGDPRYGWWDQNNFKVGGEIWGGNTLFTIPDLRVMQVKVQIHEADINKIKTEMAANVTMDTYAGLTLNGKITKIAAIAAGAGNPWGGEQDVKKFDVEITLEGTTLVELKPGISAKAEIMIDTRKDAVYVPLQCAFLEGGKQWCYALAADRQPSKREVKPGMSNESYIEILDGLKEGEQVLLYNPSVPTGAAPSDEAAPDKNAEPKKSAPPPGPAAAPVPGA
jgi:HlyD family secretion protein